MKIENKNKRKAMSNWLEKTGNGARRRFTATTVQAREYMKTPPYCGAFSRAADREA